MYSKIEKVGEFRIKAYLELCRISNLPSVWTNVLCAYVLSTGRFEAAGFSLLAASLSCFYLAGMCLNDLCDRGHDFVHRPSRPIPSGRVSVKSALLLTIALFASGFVLLYAAPFLQGLFAALLLLAAIVWYDLNHKENPFSVLLMASCRFLVFGVTALAATGTLSSLVVAAGVVQFGYIVGISLVARHENSRSTPFTLPVIPLMLAFIPILDGIILAILVTPLWLAAGLGGALLLHVGHGFVRGD